MTEIMNYEMESSTRILVVGVGNAGTSAVNWMIDEGLEGVKFACVNMGKKILRCCKAPVCIQIGERPAGGSGAVEDRKIVERETEESRNEFEDAMKGFHMVFIICGMGGETGTRAAPVVAQIAKDMGMLTVGIVTKPFCFEGKNRMAKANSGIQKLKDHVDTLIVISNDKMLEVRGECAFESSMFCMADMIFQKMVQAITELLTRPALIGLAFPDAVTVMQEKGMAYVGIGSGIGISKYQDAVHEAVANPLLETSIEGASFVIVNVSGKTTLYEAHEVCFLVQEKVGDDASIILCVREDDECPDMINITVIATGIKEREKSVLDFFP